MTDVGDELGITQVLGVHAIGGADGQVLGDRDEQFVVANDVHHQIGATHRWTQ